MAISIDLALENICDSCSGKGVPEDWQIEFHGYKRGEPCKPCKGTGWVISSLGEDLIDFLKRHKKLYE